MDNVIYCHSDFKWYFYVIQQFTDTVMPPVSTDSIIHGLSWPEKKICNIKEINGS
jgi:hypothetical protein